jgi:hypothetical protein
MIIAGHDGLTETLVGHEDTPGFFRDLMEEPVEAHFMRPAVQLIRRLPITERFVRRLRRAGTVEVLQSTIARYTDAENVKIGLLFFGAVGRVTWIPEMDSACEYITQQIRKSRDPGLRTLAIQVATTLSRWENCSLKFRELRVEHALRKDTDRTVERFRRRLETAGEHGLD